MSLKSYVFITFCLCNDSVVHNVFLLFIVESLINAIKVQSSV